jgi:hypothetical protein
MRLWENEAPGEAAPATCRDYEVLGYVISGKAELLLEGTQKKKKKRKRKGGGEGEI